MRETLTPGVMASKDWRPKDLRPSLLIAGVKGPSKYARSVAGVASTARMAPFEASSVVATGFLGDTRAGMAVGLEGVGRFLESKLWRQAGTLRGFDHKLTRLSHTIEYHTTLHCITHYLLLVGEPASDRLLTDDSESLLDRRLDGDSGCDPRF